MANPINKDNSIEMFQQVFTAASQMPGVKIDREKYLYGALKGKYSPEVVNAAIETSPAIAGITPKELSSIADSSIAFESAKVTALSVAAGLPGGVAMAGTIPADLAQYFAHILRIAQKLAYLYGWENMFSGTEDELDDAAKNMLILFVGVMFGAQGASEAVTKIATMAAEAAAKRIPQQALTKGILYPVVKKVATYLGVQMTKEIYGKGVSKIIPVVGGIISGGITASTYVPMCKKLKNYLAKLPVAKPETYAVSSDDVEDVSYEE